MSFLEHWVIVLQPQILRQHNETKGSEPAFISLAPLLQLSCFLHGKTEINIATNIFRHSELNEGFPVTLTLKLLEEKLKKDHS